MSRRAIQWLYQELPGLVDRGVLTPDAAQRLREHYGDVSPVSRSRVALLLFGLLGAALIGSGIILLIAHNWEQLSRPMRVVVAFMPLVAGQVLVLYTLLFRGRSTPWREGSAVFLIAAIGACIAIIGQTYNLPADWPGFMLTWSLLAVPLIYILPSTAACVLYLGGILIWAGAAQSGHGHAVAYWPLLALAVPHIGLALRHDPYSPRAVLLGYAFCFNLCIGLGIVLEKALPGLWIVCYTGLFGAMYLLGERWRPDWALSPWRMIGGAGALVLALLLTFDWTWDDIGRHHFRSGYGYHPWMAIQDYVIALGLLAASVWMLVIRRTALSSRGWFVGLVPLLALGGYVLVDLGAPAAIPMAVFNVYVFVMGLGTLVHGVRQDRLAVANLGMAMITVLALFRFFDLDIGLVLRGVLFILIGIGFLVANVIIVRRGETAGDAA